MEDVVVERRVPLYWPFERWARFRQVFSVGRRFNIEAVVLSFDHKPSSEFIHSLAKSLGSMLSRSRVLTWAWASSIVANMCVKKSHGT